MRYYMSRKEWANIVLCLLVFGVAGYGIHLIAGASDIVDLFNPEPKVSSVVADLGELVSLDSSEFEINGVSKQVKAGFRITNNSHGPVKDIVITCDLKDRKNELRGREKWVIYDTVAPLESAHFVLEDRRYISHLVVPESISCRVIDLKDSGMSITTGNSDNH